MSQRISKWVYGAFLSLALAVCPAQSAQRGYTVQAGDTPCEIAERFGMRCVDLMAINSLEEDDLIHIGQRLRLANSTTVADTPKESSATHSDGEEPVTDGPARIVTLLSRHATLLAAESEVAASRHKIDVARSVWQPQLDLEFKSGTEEIDNPATADTDLNVFQAKVLFEQKLIDFGQADTRIDSALRRADTAELTAHNIRQSLILDGLLVLLDLKRTRAVLDFARESEVNIKAQTGIEAVLYDRGYTAGIDVLQANAQLARAQARLVQAEHKLSLVQNRFAALFGVEPSSKEPVPGFPPQVVQLTLNEALVQVERGNIEIKLAEHNLEIMRLEARALWLDRFPKVDLVGEYRNKHNVAGISGTEEDRRIMVRLTYNLADGNRRRATQYAAESRVTAAEKQLTGVRRSQVEAARNAFADLDANRANSVFFRNQAELTRRFLELAHKQRKLGERSLLDVLANETSLFNARSDAVAVDISTIEAAYRLLRVLGSLDQTSVFWQ
jgi:adhesin transport system outer membrane protein